MKNTLLVLCLLIFGTPLRAQQTRLLVGYSQSIEDGELSLNFSAGNMGQDRFFRTIADTELAGLSFCLTRETARGYIREVGLTALSIGSKEEDLERTQTSNPFILQITNSTRLRSSVVQLHLGFGKYVNAVNDRLRLALTASAAPFFRSKASAPLLPASFPLRLRSGGIHLGIGPRLSYRLSDRLALRLDGSVSLLSSTVRWHNADNPFVIERDRTGTTFEFDGPGAQWRATVGVEVGL